MFPNSFNNREPQTHNSKKKPIRAALRGEDGDFDFPQYFFRPHVFYSTSGQIEMPRRQIEDRRIRQACALIDRRGNLLVTSPEWDGSTERA